MITERGGKRLSEQETAQLQLLYSLGAALLWAADSEMRTGRESEQREREKVRGDGAAEQELKVIVMRTRGSGRLAPIPDAGSLPLLLETMRLVSV